MTDYSNPKGKAPEKATVRDLTDDEVNAKKLKQSKEIAQNHPGEYPEHDERAKKAENKYDPTKPQNPADKTRFARANRLADDGSPAHSEDSGNNTGPGTVRSAVRSNQPSAETQRPSDNKLGTSNTKAEVVTHENPDGSHEVGSDKAPKTVSSRTPENNLNPQVVPTPDADTSTDKLERPL